jgi:pre-mRNA-splicing factor ATP-dependent RNA helicase DHX38/PRP16
MPHLDGALYILSFHSCVAEVLTAVALLSTDNIFIHPHREADKQAANAAHRRFSSRDGDIPALINIYDAWLQTKKDKAWASKNYLSQRSLLHATSIRQQLSNLVKSVDAGIDPEISCLPEKDPFLRCLTAGLFLNIAKLVINADGVYTSSAHSNTSFANSFTGASDTLAPYKTMRGSQPVHIHPSSVLFALASNNMKKLPSFVVYSELLITTKQYMRGVTAIDGSWLPELATGFHSKGKRIDDSTEAGTKTDINDRSRFSSNNTKLAMMNDALHFQTKAAAVSSFAKPAVNVGHNPHHQHHKHLHAGPKQVGSANIEKKRKLSDL